MPRHIEGGAAPGPSSSAQFAPQQQQQQQQQQQHGQHQYAQQPPQGQQAQTQQQQQPAPQQAAVQGNVLFVSTRQQGNPLLKHIRLVRWQYREITPDYQMGPDAAAVFLSIRYHLLHPNYVLPRLKSLSRAFRLLVLLVHVDTEEAARPLRELTRVAVGLDATLVCGFSNEECARYLELFKSYEQKPAAAIQARTDTDYVGRLTSALTSVRGVNRNDSYTIGATFGTLADAFRAPAARFSSCPGLGPVKARRLHDAFSQPFRRTLVQQAGGAVAGGGGGGGHATCIDGGGEHAAQQTELRQERQQDDAPRVQQGGGDAHLIAGAVEMPISDEEMSSELE